MGVVCYKMYLFLRKLKEKRKKTQEANKKAKEEAKQEHREKSLKGILKGKSETDVQMQKSSQEANEEAPIEEDDDREYYKQEVGEEPDKGKEKNCFKIRYYISFSLLDLFSSNTGGVKRKFDGSHFRKKKIKLDGQKQYPPSFPRGKEKKPFNKANKSKNDKFTGRKFKGDKNTKNKGRGADKTNSFKRDHRPIGGKILKIKFKAKNKR